MVKVSPDTAVVMPVPPATLIVSPVFNVTPVLSSPTTVMVELVRYDDRSGPVMVNEEVSTNVGRSDERVIVGRLGAKLMVEQSLSFAS